MIRNVIDFTGMDFKLRYAWLNYERYYSAESKTLILDKKKKTGKMYVNSGLIFDFFFLLGRVTQLKIITVTSKFKRTR